MKKTCLLFGSSLSLSPHYSDFIFRCIFRAFSWPGQERHIQLKDLKAFMSDYPTAHVPPGAQALRRILSHTVDVTSGLQQENNEMLLTISYI